VITKGPLPRFRTWTETCDVVEPDVGAPKTTLDGSTEISGDVTETKLLSLSQPTAAHARRRTEARIARVVGDRMDIKSPGS